MTSSLTNENTRNGLCALTSCHFAIRACHTMIILPYARIARYWYAASTDDTEGGRAQRSSGVISMDFLYPFRTQNEMQNYFWLNILIFQKSEMNLPNGTFEIAWDFFPMWQLSRLHFLCAKYTWGLKRVFSLSNCSPLEVCALKRVWVTQSPQICIKLTQFEDNHGRMVPFKYYLVMRCCSFWEMSETSHTNNL